MAKTLTKSNKKYFICEECNFAYLDRKIAAKCEEYCKKYHSCSLDITKKAIKI